MATTKVTLPVTSFGEDHEARLDALEGVGDSEGFLALGDTPTSYTGFGGLSVTVKDDETGLEFVAIGGSGDPVTFLGLTGTPGSWGTDGQYLRYNEDTEALEWVNPPAAPISQFTHLTDTFGEDELAANPGKAVVINSDGTALTTATFPTQGVQTFLDLSDTPEVLGAPGSIVVVDAEGGTLSFADPSVIGGSSTTFIALTDTPSGYTPGQYLRVNAGGTAIEYVPASWPTNFKALSDTPVSFAGQVGKVLRVNAAETALEFVAQTTATTSITQLTDTPSGLGTAGQLLAMNAGATALEWVAPSASVVDEFLDLIDTPANYTGANGKYVTVSGTSLVFTTLPTIPTALVSMTGFPSTFTGSTGKYLQSNGTALEFVDAPSGGSGTSGPAPILVAVTNETAVITTGSAKVTFRAPYAFTLGNVRASLTTASSSGAVTVNVKRNGTTVFSTPLTIDASEKTSVTATTPMVLSITAISDDDEFTVDIDGAGTNAVGLKVTLIPA